MFTVKFISRGRSCQTLLFFTYFRFPVSNHIFAIDSQHRPSVYPPHRQQMRYTADRTTVLHDDEPPISILQLYHSPLVQSVRRIRCRIFHNHLMFIRAVNIFRTKTDLPTFRTSCRTGDIVHTIYFIHMGSFHAEIRPPGPAVFKTFVPYLYRFAFNRFHIRIQFRYEQPVLSVDYIYFAVIIEKQSRII